MARPSVFSSRPSLWAGSQTLAKPDVEECSPHLLACCDALRDACKHMHASQVTLRGSVSDLPRMSQVLDNDRLFVVVNESTVRQYAIQMQEEIEPQVAELLSLAERGVKQLEREQAKIQTKVDQAGHANKHAVSAAAKMEMRRLNMLNSQRARLEKEVKSLEQEIAQMESKAKR